jgi:hypothetical protein
MAVGNQIELRSPYNWVYTSRKARTFDCAIYKCFNVIKWGKTTHNGWPSIWMLLNCHVLSIIKNHGKLELEFILILGIGMESCTSRRQNFELVTKNS